MDTKTPPLKTNTPLIDTKNRETNVPPTEINAPLTDTNAPFPVLFYITAPHTEAARTLAQSLLNKKLAACVNMFEGVTSLYVWQGQCEEQSEIILIGKTLSSHTQPLIEHVKSIHPYECPCVVTFPILQGNTDFLQWIAQNVQ
jgi:periplasmic divalent cation tolerance protein